MIVQDMTQLKNMLQQVLIDEGFIAFCQKCPAEQRCCTVIKPFCEYSIKGIDCAEDSGTKIGGKPLDCLFYICPIVGKKNPNVGNWLQRVRSSLMWPNQAQPLKFPLTIEDFKEK